MQGIDLIGIEAVCAYIRATGFNHFYIHKYNSNAGAFPLYEHSARNNNDAAEAFKNWAALCNPDANLNYYSITVCEVAEGTEENARKQRNKKYKMSFVLTDHNGHAKPQNSNTSFSNPGSDYLNRKDVAAMIEDKYELAFLRLKVQDLTTENKELKEDLDDAEDEIEKLEKQIGESAPDYLSILNNFMGDKKKTEPAKEGATLSGVSVTDEQKTKINTAVKTLLKYDADLDVHLAKLAKLAKEDTPKFKVLLSYLDGF